jgi:hypothetical protein
MIDIDAAGATLTADQPRSELEAITSRRDVMAPWQAQMASDVREPASIVEFVRRVPFTLGLAGQRSCAGGSNLDVPIGLGRADTDRTMFRPQKDLSQS